MSKAYDREGNVVGDGASSEVVTAASYTAAKNAVDTATNIVHILGLGTFEATTETVTGASTGNPENANEHDGEYALVFEIDTNVFKLFRKKKDIEYEYPEAYGGGWAGFAAAVTAAATSKRIVKLQKNLTATSEVSLDNVKINLNGKTIHRAEDVQPFLVDGADVWIYGGKITGVVQTGTASSHIPIRIKNASERVFLFDLDISGGHGGNIKIFDNDTKDVHIKFCRIGACSEGTQIQYFDRVSNIYIEHNEIYEKATGTSAANAIGGLSFVGNFASNVVIRHNHILESARMGIEVQRTDDINVSHNRIFNCASMGISLPVCGNSEISYNYIDGYGSYGIEIGGATQFNCVNNTLKNGSSSMSQNDIIVNSSGTPATKSILKGNNIYTSNSDVFGISVQDNSVNIEISGNTLINAGGINIDGQYIEVLNNSVFMDESGGSKAYQLRGDDVTFKGNTAKLRGSYATVNPLLLSTMSNPVLVDNVIDAVGASVTFLVGNTAGGVTAATFLNNTFLGGSSSTVSISTGTNTIKEWQNNFATGVVSVTATRTDGYTLFPREGGTTAQRPAAPQTYSQYYDTTIDKLILYDGSGWVDFQGGAV